MEVNNSDFPEIRRRNPNCKKKKPEKRNFLISIVKQRILSLGYLNGSKIIYSLKSYYKQL
jgi:hypothetical protein